MLTARINRGIQFLDTHAPDWRDRVNLDDLDMGDEYNDVLNAAFPQQGGRTGTDFVFDTFGYSFDLAAHGFDRGDEESWEVYDDLTAAWTEVLQTATV